MSIIILIIFYMAIIMRYDRNSKIKRVEKSQPVPFGALGMGDDLTVKVRYRHDRRNY